MRNYLKFFLLICILSSPGITFAGSSEEETCLELLADEAKKDIRYFDTAKQPLDLTKSKLSNDAKQLINLTKYKNNFLSQREENISAKSGDKKLFYLPRNNVVAYVADENYIVQQYVNFGEKSNLDFPISAWFPEDKFQKIAPFHERILYTHHLAATGDFLSCGFIQLKPVKRGLMGFGSGGYIGNSFLKDSLQILNKYPNQSIGGGSKGDFKSAKFNFYGFDAENKGSLEFHVVSVFFNNKSTYFNEYPLVEKFISINNSPDTATLMADKVKQFADYVKDENCFKLAHKDKATLPKKCNGEYKALSYAPLWKTIGTSILPQAYARMEVSSIDPEINEKAKDAQGGIVYGIPGDLFGKLQSIPEENLRLHLRVILGPAEDISARLKQSGQPLPEHLRLLEECGIPLLERRKIVIDFLQKLDIAKYNPKEFEYLNPKFGDCVIPYPDKRNRTAIQPLSFEFNKLLFEAETLESSVQENQKNLLEKKKALASLEQDYSKQLNEQLIKFQSQSSESTLDTSGLSKFASDYEQKKAAILAEIEELTAKQNELTSSGSKNLQDKIQQYNSKTLDPVKKEDGINLYISLLLGLLGVGLLVFAIKIKTKK